MNRDKSDTSIIPKIIILLGTLSVLGIILLFFRPRPKGMERGEKPKDPQKLFTQVIRESETQLLKLWREGDSLIKKPGPNCMEEIAFETRVGRNYYQCQPHFWQCYWQGGIVERPTLEIDLFGQTYHVRARAAYPPISEYSPEARFYQIFQRREAGLPLNQGMLVELEVEEIPNFSMALILTDSCRDTYLPQRIYAYGKAIPKSRDEGFIWDNFDRNIFVDKFYVTNQQVNEWRLLTGEKSKFVHGRKKWPEPAFVNLKEQKAYCASMGKRVMEATLFDAATMTPSDTRNALPERVTRPQTPWQRDLSKTFIGMSKINSDYQLTPLDCQLAQVKGCTHRLFTTDSATWMGLHYALGFYPESLINTVEPEKNLKNSSQYLLASDEAHVLGSRSHWNGEQGTEEQTSVAFRCYEEVSP